MVHLSLGHGAGRALRSSQSATLPMLNGKAVDLTGPGLTEKFGVTCTDLGASVTAPNGSLVSVFGDTFSGRRVGEGDWRSPVILIGTGDANHRIVYERAGGPDPDYARQLWHYVHDDASTGWSRGGISTVIPSDLLCVGDAIYLHAIVNRGFSNVIWTEIWRSDDSGISWVHLGSRPSSRPACTVVTRSAGHGISIPTMAGFTWRPPDFNVTKASS